MNWKEIVLKEDFVHIIMDEDYTVQGIVFAVDPTYNIYSFDAKKLTIRELERIWKNVINGKAKIFAAKLEKE